MTLTVQGVRIPDSKLAREITELVRLVTAGVEMDVLGLSYHEYSDAARRAVVEAHPRGNHFKNIS
jgi:hypothetical protein